MRVNRNNFLFVIGLIVTLGISTVMANGGDDKNKRPKNTGTLSVRTTETSYPVKVDGQYVGDSGVGTGAEFYLSPGFHTVEVTGPESEVDTFVALVRNYGIKELVRTGSVVMSRGSSSIEEAVKR